MLKIEDVKINQEIYFLFGEGCDLFSCIPFIQHGKIKAILTDRVEVNFVHLSGTPSEYRKSYVLDGKDGKISAAISKEEISFIFNDEINRILSEIDKKRTEISKKAFDELAKLYRG